VTIRTFAEVSPSAAVVVIHISQTAKAPEFWKANMRSNAKAIVQPMKQTIILASSMCAVSGGVGINEAVSL
jgi:hypothetical protein